MALVFATKDADGKALSFTLVRGARWDDDVQLVDQETQAPIDLTGIVSLMMRVRTRITDATNVMELSLANGRLVMVDAATGKVGIRVSTADSLTFPQNGNRKAKYKSDLVIERTAGEYEPGISAGVTVLPQITRPTEPA